MKTLVAFTIVFSRGSEAFTHVILTPTRSRMMLLRSVTSSTSTPDRLFPEELNILYDSKCNVCNLEINFLRRRDQKLNGDQPKLKFTDLESSRYDDQDPANAFVDYEKGMKAMHAVKPNGKLMVGVPVFSEAYKQVNLGWLFAITRVPGFNWLADRGYDLFAKYRTIITRGKSVDNLVEVYKEKRLLMEKQKDRANSECDSCNEKSTKV